MLIDTHIHLDRFSPGIDLEDELEAARAAGIREYIVPGVRRQEWEAIREVVARTGGAYAAYGIHPLAAGEWDASCADALMHALKDDSAVAVGEIGLDRSVDVPLLTQEKAFREQLQIAVELDVPLLIHCRKMPGRLLEILHEENAERIGGIMHAFSGSFQTAQAAIELGFVLSFGGALTYPEARRALEVLPQLPDESIVIETDAPDMAPHPYRGLENRPLWLLPVLEKLAELKGWSVAEAAQITTANARRVLKLKE